MRTMTIKLAMLGLPWIFGCSDAAIFSDGSRSEEDIAATGENDLGSPLDESGNDEDLFWDCLDE